VASADFNHDLLADIVVAAGAGGGPHVRVLSGANGSEILGFFAYDAAFAGGVRVATSDVNHDGTPEILTSPGQGGGPHVKATNVLNGTEILSFFALDANFMGGLFLAGSSMPSIASSLRLAEGYLPDSDLRPLELADVQVLFAAAFVRLESAGVSQTNIEGLKNLSIQIEDLSGDQLGQAIEGAIVIDSNAAGHGWYIDPTPFADEEFSEEGRSAIDSEIIGRVDLLTALFHELGHHLGRVDLDAEIHPDEIMTARLSPGQRRLPFAEHLDQLFADQRLLGHLLAE
jgi:hypothetical protein